MRMLRKHDFLGRMLFALILPLSVSGVSWANTWYVRGGADPSGHGSINSPFADLQDVEHFSAPGDTIFVIPSKTPLDGGLQLKDNQQLIGLGTPVNVANPDAAQALITNTSAARYDGDGIRLAK